MPATTPLVRVYIDALCGRAIYVHGGLKSWAVLRSFEVGPKPSKNRMTYLGFKSGLKKPVAKLWFARPAHAELVLLRCRQDFQEIGVMAPSGWVNLLPAEVLEKVK